MLNCQDLVLHAVDYITIVDRNFNIVFNARYEPQVNVTAQLVKRSEYINKKFYEVYSELDIEDSTIMRCLRTGEVSVRKNQAIRDFNGHLICTDNITLPIIRKGRIMGAVELARDVTTVDFKNHETVPGTRDFDRLADTIKEHHGLITFDSILTRNEELLRTIEYARILSSMPNHTLIYGETGTGKELFAQAMITASGLPRTKVIIENCAAIPENLFESILFGTSKGAYTGAENRKGLLEEADGGILFLDELNAMPYAVQGKLLRVLQEGTFRKLGSNVEKKVNVKIIAAMNVDPTEAIESNILRRDLFFRFSSSMIHIPSLSDRPEDLPLYLDHFLKEYNEVYGKQICGYDEELETLLKNYTWEGNVRELKHLVESMVTVCQGDMLRVKDMPDYVYNRVKKGQSVYEKETIQIPYKDFDFSNINEFSLQRSLENHEREIITAVLKHCGGNKAKASRLLDIPRPTLIYKMEKLGIK